MLKFPFSKDYTLNYKEEWIDKRIQFLNQQCNTDLIHVRKFSYDSQKMIGNIENPIGCAQVPIGLSGPLTVNGAHAKGEFYIPLATTEGALVLACNIGMNLLSKSGGVNTMVLKDVVHVSPLFQVAGMENYSWFINWLDSHFEQIRIEAEKTTKYGKLLSIVPKMTSEGIIVTFSYSTGDAMGLNMIVKATHAAITYIADCTKTKFFLRSNFSSDKKISAYNYAYGYGKEIFAEATLPQKLFDDGKLNTTPKDVIANYHNARSGSIHAGMVGSNAHIANILAAIFIACGQDVAHITNCCAGITGFKLLSTGDLYCSLYIPGLLIGTVGGGVSLPTQKECLEILGCYGNGKAKKFAEIIAASALAAEVSISIALTNGSFVDAHEFLGRNRP